MSRITRGIFCAVAFLLFGGLIAGSAGARDQMWGKVIAIWGIGFGIALAMRPSPAVKIARVVFAFGAALFLTWCVAHQP